MYKENGPYPCKNRLKTTSLLLQIKKKVVDSVLFQTALLPPCIFIECKHMCLEMGGCVRTSRAIISRLPPMYITGSHISGGYQVMTTAEHDTWNGTRVGMPKKCNCKPRADNQRTPESSPNAHVAALRGAPPPR